VALTSPTGRYGAGVKKFGYNCVANDLQRIPDSEPELPIPSVIELPRIASGINVAAAVRTAWMLGPGHTVVTILADGGARYQSKLFNPNLLRSKNLPLPGWLTNP